MSILLIHKQTLRHDQIQLVFRASHGDVKQAAFFFDLVRGPGCFGRRNTAVHDI